MAYYFNDDIQNKPNLEGVFFLIDGEIFVNAINGQQQLISNQAFFLQITDRFDHVRNKYMNYHYLMFPQGKLFYDTDHSLVIDAKFIKEAQYFKDILIAFNHRPNEKVEREYSSEALVLDQLINQDELLLTHQNRDFIKLFYKEQVRKFCECHYKGKLIVKTDASMEISIPLNTILKNQSNSFTYYLVFDSIEIFDLPNHVLHNIEVKICRFSGRSDRTFDLLSVNSHRFDDLLKYKNILISNDIFEDAINKKVITANTSDVILLSDLLNINYRVGGDFDV